MKKQERIEDRARKANMFAKTRDFLTLFRISELPYIATFLGVPEQIIDYTDLGHGWILLKARCCLYELPTGFAVTWKQKRV